MMMIILDPANAEAVRGRTADGAALDPRPLADGTFALPECVLGDPAHIIWHTVLAAVPRRSLAECNWRYDEEEA